MQRPGDITRRSFLWQMVAIPAAFILAACRGRSRDNAVSAVSTPSQPAAATAPAHTAGATVVESLPPTPACGDDDDDPTPAQTEGPFFTPNSPERTSLLEAGIAGTRLTVTGHVLGTDCSPIAGALLDFWHCDDAGVYDNVGYKLRGHQFADEAGRYTLETILPGLYPGRTRHIHVKAQAPNQPVLTTQLYFPGEPGNRQDGIYNPALEMAVTESGDGLAASFDFVLVV